ncbi:hypothetical protein GCM10025876_24780 [Demequina litorisediminis]|uniref:DUF3817 domain-containing protein n=2 Tax=Demequina litorisediminis TaxID=1849022 RepID=A0ABQ6IEX0_9MICO|nr:hypothetical protein GCM10025876_24780 [Demequina litorisediminis]
MSTNFAIDAAARAILFTDARSNLVFADRPVAMETVRDVWDLIKWGPTANNTVPLRVLAATSDTARAAVLDAAAAGNRDKIAAAPLVLVAARDERFHETFGITGGSETAAARFEADPETRTRFSHTNTMLQTGYLILGLRAAGLAVRPVGGFDRAALDAALFADASWRSEPASAGGSPRAGARCGRAQGPHRRRCRGARGMTAGATAPGDTARARLTGIGRAYAILALVEAITWTGLLIGMGVKYGPQTTEIGVTVFGPLHGIAFLAYAAVTVIAAVRLRWGLGVTLLALVAAVPPLTTLPMEMWLRRTGRLAPR